jgi:effector-binding domain-containing protein
MGYEIHLTDLSRLPAAVVRAQVAAPDLPDFLGHAFEEVLAVAGRQGLAPAGPPFGRYLPTGDGFEVAVGFPLDGEVVASGRVTPDELPGGTVATTLHTGPYDEVAAAYDATTRWVAEHGLTASGPAWESYLDDPDVPVPRTEVHLPCEAAS